MEGRSLDTGAVTGVEHLKNRKVVTKIYADEEPSASRVQSSAGSRHRP